MASSTCSSVAGLASGRSTVATTKETSPNCVPDSVIVTGRPFKSTPRCARVTRPGNTPDQPSASACSRQSYRGEQAQSSTSVAQRAQQALECIVTVAWVAGLTSVGCGGYLRTHDKAAHDQQGTCRHRHARRNVQ